ncbi:hypothetical protein D6855_09725 [Butyrivibrio sp. CB08]|uniref:hypothetical protein n=1 Tax=Butyrivibrio sp. CB08 TaxID=2364879 RepID=UPI000EA9CB2C|nr:hypothetical protein [Butyrivibrio sp. CB08]RKM59178.1 hypothetical protein D6855_09725 [Butyrivibrio sp. CB08]
MNTNGKNNKEIVAAVASLLLMWIGYYGDNNLFKDNMIYTLLVSLLMIIIGLCTLLPVIWVTRVTKEGLQGLGVTTKKLGLALLFSVVLGAWRFIGIREYLNGPDVINTILFNAFSIWEVMFIFGWLFTRYKRAFGKVAAVLLTALSVGIYHIGTLGMLEIGKLCLTVAICGVFYAISENIFTLWPIYWAIGCSASTLSSGMSFPVEMVYISAITLIIQLVIILFLARKSYKHREKAA